MAKHKERITGKNAPSTPAERKKRLTKRQSDYFQESEYNVDYCMTDFLHAQVQRQNSKATIDYYKRFKKKFYAMIETYFSCSPKEAPIEMLYDELTQTLFITSLGDVNQQTVNSYLRGYRSFGNYCKETGFIESFDCPIKEVEPPVKQVYTDYEIEKLMKKPPITDFSDFRMYCIIGLILNTGARCNTILNIRIEDIEFEEGYINFNTTKAHKIVRLGLDKRVKKDLHEWVEYWRYGKGAEPSEYLFCNEYGEQMSRSTITKAMRVYCHRRGVEKTSLHLLRHPYVKPTTKNISLQKQKSQTTKVH